MQDFHSNSRMPKKTQQVEKPEPKSVAPVVTGGVRRRKKGPLKRAAELFTGDSEVSVTEYLLAEVIVPGFKQLLFQTITTGADRRLFGGQYSGRPGGFGAQAPGWTNYRNAPTSLRGGGPSVAPVGMTSRARARHDFSEIVFDNRVDAVEVLNTMFAMLAEYEVVSVRHFYELCDESFSFADAAYGWTDLTGSDVRHDGRNGYRIILPQPQPIN